MRRKPKEISAWTFLVFAAALTGGYESARAIERQLEQEQTTHFPL